MGQIGEGTDVNRLFVLFVKSRRISQLTILILRIVVLPHSLIVLQPLVQGLPSDSLVKRVIGIISWTIANHGVSVLFDQPTPTARLLCQSSNTSSSHNLHSSSSSRQYLLARRFQISQEHARRLARLPPLSLPLPQTLVNRPLTLYIDKRS